MDVFAHALWGSLPFRYKNIRRKKKFNLWITSFWAVFPDLFAFTIPFVWLILGLIFGWTSLSNFRSPETNSFAQNPPAVFSLASNLYNFSHSLVIFLIVFFAIFLFRKKFYWPLAAWAIHIILDVPSHSYQFYPTPLFWPVLGWKFNGISWANPTFMIINYSLLIICYLLVWRLERRNKKLTRLRDY